MGQPTHARRGGKKNRKHGGTKKSPAMIRYVAENRREKNKARRIAKAEREKLKHREKKNAV